MSAAQVDPHDKMRSRDVSKVARGVLRRRMKNTKVNARNLPSITVLSVLLSGLRGGMSRGNKEFSQGPSESVTKLGW
ncbi:Putative cytochrome c oxidase subunit 6b-like [Linum perenne]